MEHSGNGWSSVPELSYNAYDAVASYMLPERFARESLFTSILGDHSAYCREWHHVRFNDEIEAETFIDLVDLYFNNRLRSTDDWTVEMVQDWIERCEQFCAKLGVQPDERAKDDLLDIIEEI